MAGTVRGTFDLNDRPAADAMRRLRREGKETDAVFQRLGRTVDDTFNQRNIEQGRRYERMLRDVRETARSSLGTVRREWKSTERQTVKSVAASEAAIDRMQERLERLGKTRATPRIDLDGFADSLAQVEILHKRINALGREVAHPRIAPPVASGAVTRAVTTASGGRSGSSIPSGVFGNRSPGLQVPFAGTVPWSLVGGALAATPPLIGGAGALAGSLGAATLGAGSIGLGGAGVGAAAIGSIAPIAISSIKGIGEASKALEKYREEVIQSGRNSKAAHLALRAYNMSLEDAPGGTRAFLRARTRLSEEFGEATAPARADFTRIGTRGINVARNLTPLTGRLSNRFFSAARGEADEFGDFLEGGRSRAFIRSMGNEATRSLDPLEGITENIAETFMNLSRSARPFFREGLDFLEEWTGGWRKNSRDIKDVRSTMRGWVGNLKDWGRLVGATWKLTRDALGAGTGSGRSMVRDLTSQLNEWDRWIQRNPRQVRSFYRESVDTVEKVASGFSRIATTLWEVGRLLGPLLKNAAQLVTLLGNAGLLTAGGLPLLIAGGAGIRNTVRGARGAILGGGAAGGGASLAQGAVLGAAATGGAAGGGAFARSRGALSSIGGYAGRLRSAYSSTGRVPVMSAPAGRALTMGMEADAGLLGATRFSRTAGAAGAGRILGSTGLRYGGLFARGAAARFAPIAALMGGLQALSFPGNFGERSQAFASGATVGFVPMPKTGDEEKDQGNEYAGQVADYYGRRYGSRTVGDLQEQIGAVRRKRHRLLRTEHPPVTGITIGESIQSGISQLLGDGPTRGTKEPSGTDRAEAAALGKHLQSLRDQRVGRASGGALGEIQSVFGVRTGRGGQNPVEAFKSAAVSIEKRAGQLKGRTSQEFTQMSLDWAKQMARSNPRLRSVYKEMAEELEGRLRKLGRNVAVIHGNIVDVSKNAWDRIPEQISSAYQRALSAQTEGLTALERQAITSLRRMGYSKGEAKRLTLLAQTGGPAGQRLASQAAQSGPLPDNVAGPQISDIRPGKFDGGNFSGGRLPAQRNGSMQDDIYLGGGQWGASGELMVNRHTERRVDRYLRMAGTSLGREVGREQRPHSAMFRPQFTENAAFGRRFATGGVMAAGRLASKMGLSVSEGPGYGGIPSSGHTGGSLHYSGLAYDVSGSPALMRRYFFAAQRAFRGQINELFYDPIGWYLDQGRKVPGAIGGHGDHVHIGFNPGGARLAGGALRGLGGAGGAGGAAVPNIRLNARKSGLAGIPGAVADKNNQTMAKGMSDRLNRLIGGARGGGGMGAPGGSRSAVERQIARELFRHGANKIGAAGIIGNAYAESSMDPGAEGTGGGGLWGFTAGAISLANLKAAGGKNWQSPQFQTRFMLQHGGQGLIPALNKSGSPEAAARLFMEQWERPGIPRLDVREAGARTAFSQGFARGGKRGFAGWFRDGGRGRVHGPTLIGLGEAGPEDFQVTPTPRRRSAARRGGGGGGGHSVKVDVNMGSVTIRGSQDAKRVGKDIGDQVAVKIRDALADSDGVGDGELVG